MRYSGRITTAASQHYSPADLAGLVKERGLAGLPATAKGWSTRADRENWPWRPRKGRGGGKEYPEDCLPEQITQKVADKVFTPNNKLAAIGNILFAYDGAKSTVSIDAFCNQYNRNEILTDEECREEYSCISVANLRRWLSFRKKGNLLNLFSNNKRGRDVSITDDQKNAILGLVAKHTNITAVQVHNLLVKSMDNAPSLRTVQRFLKYLKTMDRKTYLALTDPDKFKNNYQPAFGVGDYLATHTNAEWQLDSTILDNADSEGIRPTIVGVMDVYSRRVMYLVAESSSATAIKALLRLAILEWGVPDMIHTDNGKDYISKEVKIACGLLDIQQNICTAYSPEQKGHVERMFNTLTVQYSTMTDGYVGRNTDDARKIRGKKAMADRKSANKITGLHVDKIQPDINDWVDKYNNTVHSAHGLTPNEKAQDCPVKSIPDERILDVLLADLAVQGGKRTVGKSGLHILGVKYVSAELTRYISKRVVVKIDTVSAGKIWVYSEAGDFLCHAVNKNLLGTNLQDIAIAAKAISRAEKSQLRANAREAEKALSRSKRKDYTAELKRNIADSSGQVVMLPQAASNHTAVAVDQVSDKISTTEETPDQSFARWQSIDVQITNGKAVTDQERTFHKTYQNHPEFKVRIGVTAWG